MTVWNHTTKGTITGELVKISDNGKWADIRLTRPQPAGDPGDIIAVMMKNLDEDRSGLPRPLSPDCRDGNHTKCDTIAWDTVKDDYTACTCICQHTGGGPNG